MSIDLNLLLKANKMEKWEWSFPNELKIENDKIIADINGGFETYFPFGHFNLGTQIPTGNDEKRSCDVQKEILLDFLSIDINENDSILKFISNYGFLKRNISERPITEKTTNIYGKPLNSNNISPQFAQLFKDQIDIDKEDLPEFIIEVRYFQLLVEAFNMLHIREGKHSVDFKFFKKLTEIGEKCSPNNHHWSMEFVEELEKSKDDIKNFEEYELADILFLALEKELQERIKNVSVFPYLTGENKFIESWHADNLLSALYYMLFMAIRDKKDIRKCENKSCPEYFFIYGSDYRKIYCTQLCAKAEASRRYRQRIKQKENLPSHPSH